MRPAREPSPVPTDESEKPPKLSFTPAVPCVRVFAKESSTSAELPAPAPAIEAPSSEAQQVSSCERYDDGSGTLLVLLASAFCFFVFFCCCWGSRRRSFRTVAVATGGWIVTPAVVALAK